MKTALRPILPLVLGATAALGIETLPVDDIRPGMTGYGLSVFTEHRVDTFQVEIIDVMREVSPGGDMILARCTGQGLEHSGIIAGMSGSPVYIDGKLIGAVAYGWGFSKDPIGGITPIGEMLGVWDLKAGGGDGNGHGSSPSRKNILTRLPVPLAMSGHGQQLTGIIDTTFRSYGFIPTTGGQRGATTDEEPEALMVPGGAIGVILVTGDVRISAIGTITHREGDRLLAFGHPMFQAGAIAMPMSGGVIHTIIPSVASSFKLFSATEIIGTITQDRLPAIGGVIGPIPDMLPVDVKVKSPATDRQYAYRVARIPGFIPLLTAYGLADVVTATEGSMEEITLAAQMTLTIEDTIELTTNHLYTGRAATENLFRTAMQELLLVVENNFRPVELTRIDFDFRFRQGLRRQTIIAARPTTWTVRPGEQLKLNLTLRDQEGTLSTRTLTVDIPPVAADGTLTLVISPRDSLMFREAGRAPGLAEPTGLSALLQRVGQSGRENELVMAGYVPVGGITLDNLELPRPPPTIRTTILLGGATGPVQVTNATKLFESSWQLEGPIAGVFEIELEVRR
jgi:hypothetical protein